MSASHFDRVPAWSAAAPVTGWILLAATGFDFVSKANGAVILVATVLLGMSVFAAVHHAEVLALRLGELFGSILLAVAVTVIEVGLILSLILSGAEGVETIARDTIFSAIMIATNGVVGICLLFGGRRFGEVGFQLQGAASALAVLGTLAALTLVMPIFTVTTPGPTFSTVQLLFAAFASLVLYVAFIRVQTLNHREYFLDEGEREEVAKPPRRVALASLYLLVLTLVAVVLLAKLLSYRLDTAVARMGLPQAFVGVVVALVVLLPESIAALKAAIANRLQTSLNLALGSAVASIGLHSHSRSRLDCVCASDSLGTAASASGAACPHDDYRRSDAGDRAGDSPARYSPSCNMCFLPDPFGRSLALIRT